MTKCRIFRASRHDPLHRPGRNSAYVGNLRQREISFVLESVQILRKCHFLFFPPVIFVFYAENSFLKANLSFVNWIPIFAYWLFTLSVIQLNQTNCGGALWTQPATVWKTILKTLQSEKSSSPWSSFGNSFYKSHQKGKIFFLLPLAQTVHKLRKLVGKPLFFVPAFFCRNIVPVDFQRAHCGKKRILREVSRKNNVRQLSLVYHLKKSPRFFVVLTNWLFRQSGI